MLISTSVRPNQAVVENNLVMKRFTVFSQNCPKILACGLDAFSVFLITIVGGSIFLNACHISITTHVAWVTERMMFIIFLPHPIYFTFFRLGYVPPR